MPTAHRNEGVDPLYFALKDKYPGIVIGWIGDQAHQNRKSAHNPNAAGRVNAIDPMIGPHFTFTQCEELTSVLAQYADSRLNNIIFDKMIWDDATGRWSRYYGSDPHTNHAHIEVHDSAHTNTRLWQISPPTGRKYTMTSLNGLSLPILEYGDDDQGAGYDYVTRVQLLTRIKPDGYYGDQTAAAIKSLMGEGNGRSITLAVWKRLYGIVKV